MKTLEKIKYRKYQDFFSGFHGPEKKRIIDLIENKSIPKLKHFSDYLFIDELSDLVSPIFIEYSENNHFILTDSSEPIKKKEIAFIQGSILYFSEDDGSQEERQYDLSTREILALRKKAENFEIFASCSGISPTVIEFVGPFASDAGRDKLVTYITLEDVILEEIYENGFIQEFFNNFFVIGFSVEEPSFVSFIENYSNHFIVEVHCNGHMLKINKEDKHYFLSSKLNNDNNCSFQCTADNLSSLEENFASFLKAYNFDI